MIFYEDVLFVLPTLDPGALYSHLLSFDSSVGNIQYSKLIVMIIRLKAIRHLYVVVDWRHFSILV